MDVTRRQLAEIAEELGHTTPILESTPKGRWFGTCSCGYKSTYRTSARLAADALIHHMTKSVTQALKDGYVPGSRRVAAKVPETVAASL